MKIRFEWQGQCLGSNLDDGIAISIDMDFDGPQPNHFGVGKANRKPLELGGFVGDTEQGGSCNVDVIQVIPHCNGTHTESIGHIVDDDVFVGQVVPTEMLMALLLTIEAMPAKTCWESYRPNLEDGDRVLTRSKLEQAWVKSGRPRNIPAIVVRTRPNDLSKKSRAYREQNAPAFFSVEAVEFLNDLGCQHLLVDVPSIDRMYDDGLLTNHHLFWNVPEGSHQLAAESFRHKTITEMVFVPETFEDGVCLLSLQVPAFYTDAAPARPILYHLEEIN